MDAQQQEVVGNESFDPQKEVAGFAVIGIAGEGGTRFVGLQELASGEFVNPQITRREGGDGAGLSLSEAILLEQLYLLRSISAFIDDCAGDRREAIERARHAR